MASTPRRRPPPVGDLHNVHAKTHKAKPKPPSSTFPSSSSRRFHLEPPSNFFPSSKAEVSSLIAVVAIAVSVVICCSFVSNFINRQPKPFCDSANEIDDSLSDHCEPCPNNGVCSEGRLECARGYKKHGKLCIEDGNVNEAAKLLSKLVQARLCKEYAQYVCAGTGLVWFQKDDLWNDIDEYKIIHDHGLNEAAYELAKGKVVKSIGEVFLTRMNSQGSREFKCPEFLMECHKPLSCQIQQWIINHASFVISVGTLLLACTLALFKVRLRRNLSVRAEQIYNDVCVLLEENALIARSLNGTGEPWIVASWLRDHLLSPRERKKPILWRKVEELVQEDTRLVQYPKIVKGESKVVWEWQVEGSLSSSGKAKNGKARKPESNENTTVLDPETHSLKAGKLLYS